MENVSVWWTALNLLQKIYFCIGLAATVFLILQIITLLFGFSNDGADVSGSDADFDVDGGDFDVDSGDFDVDDGDFDADTGDGFVMFSVRGLVAFFAIGGWTGYILAPLNPVLAITCSLAAGFLALAAMAYAMRSIMKLRSNGNIDVSKAIGMNASVYLSIPPKDLGFGKINVTLEERFIEVNAIQYGDVSIPTGSNVKIIGKDGEYLVVEKR